MKKRKSFTAQPAAGGAMSEINITPMVDVLLCLLIFVIVVQPGLVKGLDLQVPPPDTSRAATTAAARDQLVLHIEKGPVYRLNDVDIPPGQLGRRVHEVYANRTRKVLFVQGAEDVEYDVVVQAVDIVRGAGVTVVGLVPRQ